MPDARERTLSGSTYFVFILIIGIIALGAWLVGSYPNQASRGISDLCVRIENGGNSRSEKLIQEQRTNTDSDTKLAKYTCQLAIYTEHLATFTKWLVIVTAGLGAISIWQAINLQRSVNVSESALVDLERPFVAIEVTDPGFEKTGTGVIMKDSLNYVAFNHGKTPAILTEFLYKVCLMDKTAELVLPQPIDPEQEFGWKLPFGNIAAAGRSHPFSFALVPEISLFDVVEIANNRRNLFLLGYVKYMDIFGSRYITGFCAFFHANSNTFRRAGDDLYNYIRKEKDTGILC
jgi:hypothetical protein